MRHWWTGRASAAIASTSSEGRRDRAAGSGPRPGRSPFPLDPGAASAASRRRGRRQASVALIGLMLLVTLAPATARAAQSVLVTTQYPSVSVAPGSSVTFNLDVAVTEAGRVDLAVAGVPDGWTATLRGGGFVVGGVYATPDEATAVRLDVTVPAAAADGASRLSVTGTGGGSTSRLDLDVRVTATAAGDVSLETNIDSLRGPSSTTFTFNLTLRNDTATELSFAATVNGPTAGWTVSATLSGQAQAASATVAAGSTQGITVSAKPPDGTDAGLYPVDITVTAGARTLSRQLSVEVTGRYELTLATSDERLSTTAAAGGESTITMVLTNDGTAALDAISFSSSAPSDWKVTFDPTKVDALAPGASTNVRAVIQPSTDAIAGDYTVTLRVSNANANPSLTIRTTVEASALGTIFGIAILLVAVVGLWWVFRTYGRR